MVPRLHLLGVSSGSSIVVKKIHFYYVFVICISNIRFLTSLKPVLVSLALICLLIEPLLYVLEIKFTRDESCFAQARRSPVL